MYISILLIYDSEQCAFSVDQMDSDSSNGGLTPSKALSDNAIVQSEQPSSSAEDARVTDKTLTMESSKKIEPNAILEEKQSSGKKLRSNSNLSSQTKGEGAT